MSKTKILKQTGHEDSGEGRARAEFWKRMGKKEKGGWVSKGRILEQNGERRIGEDKGEQEQNP